WEAERSSSSRHERRRVPPVSMRYAGEFSARDGRTLARQLVPASRSPAPARTHPGSTNLPVMARQRTVFPRDPGLQARMLLTLFLLGLLYVVFIAVLLQAGAGIGTAVV